MIPIAGRCLNLLSNNTVVPEVEVRTPMLVIKHQPGVFRESADIKLCFKIIDFGIFLLNCVLHILT